MHLIVSDFKWIKITDGRLMVLMAEEYLNQEFKIIDKAII